MTETLRHMPSLSKSSPKRVHFEELRPNKPIQIQQNRYPPKAMTVRERIKAGSLHSPPPNIPANQFANKPLFAPSSFASTSTFVSNLSRDQFQINQPLKSAMKTAMFPQQQQLAKSAKTSAKKSTKEFDEDLAAKAKIITPSIFSAPQHQQIETETDEDDEPIVVETKSKSNKSSGKKSNARSPIFDAEQQQMIDDQLKAASMITPSIFSAPPPVKPDPEEFEETNNLGKKEKSLSKKNSNATSPATKHKVEKSPVREEPVEKDGITPELIKKMAALKPLIDNATSNTDLKSDDASKSRKSGEKAAASKKSSNDDSKSKGKNGSVKSNSSAKSNDGVSNESESAATIVLGKMKSRDPVHNALNFSAIQQQQNSPAPPTAAGIRKTKK